MDNEKINLFQKKVNKKELKLSVPFSQEGQDHLLDSNFQSPRNEKEQQFNINAYHQIDQSNISANIQYSQFGTSFLKNNDHKETPSFKKKIESNKITQPKLEKLFKEDQVQQRGNLNQSRPEENKKNENEIIKKFNHNEQMKQKEKPKQIQEEDTKYQQQIKQNQQTIQKEQLSQYDIKQNHIKQNSQLVQQTIQKNQQNQYNGEQKQIRREPRRVQRQIQQIENDNQKIQDQNQIRQTPRRLMNQKPQQYIQQVQLPKKISNLQNQILNDQQKKSFSVDQKRITSHAFPQLIQQKNQDQNYQKEKLINTSKKTIIQKKESQRYIENFKELFFGQKLINQQLQNKVKQLEEKVEKLQADKKSIVNGYEKIIKNMQNLQKLEKEVQEINEKKLMFNKDIGLINGEILSQNDIPSQKTSMTHNYKQTYTTNDFNPHEKLTTYRRSSEYGLEICTKKERELFIPKYQVTSTYSNALNATNQNLYEMSESSRSSLQMGKVHKLFADVEEMLDDMRDHFQNQIRVLQQNLTRPKVPHNNPIQVSENIWEKPEEANEYHDTMFQHDRLSSVYNSPNHSIENPLRKKIAQDQNDPDKSKEKDLEAENLDRLKKVL